MERIIPFLLILWLAYCWLTRFSNNLLIVTCDVGQGDAILLQWKRWQLLIDGGRDDKVLMCLDEYLPLLDRTLEVVVATHPDSDHISGLIPVLKNYQVLTLITNGQHKETADFRHLDELVQTKISMGLQHLIAKNGLKINPPPESGISLDLFLPLEYLMEEKIEMNASTEIVLWDSNTRNSSVNIDYNDGSIVVLLRYKMIDLLLMGDLERAGELALIENEMITDVDILKVGHHGAKTSTTREFLEVIRPEISLISVGKSNNYGHPSTQVLHDLDQIGSKILRTDQVGSIVIITDGYKVWLD